MLIWITAKSIPFENNVLKHYYIPFHPFSLLKPSGIVEVASCLRCLSIFWVILLVLLCATLWHSAIPISVVVTSFCAKSGVCHADTKLYQATAFQAVSNPTSYRLSPHWKWRSMSPQTVHSRCCSYFATIPPSTTTAAAVVFHTCKVVTLKYCRFCTLQTCFSNQSTSVLTVKEQWHFAFPSMWV